MTTLIILLSAVVLFFSYTIWAIIKIGFIPNSWSDTYYELGKKGWTWQVFMVLMGFLFFGLTLELLDGYWFQFLGFFVSGFNSICRCCSKVQDVAPICRPVYITWLLIQLPELRCCWSFCLQSLSIWGVFTFPVFFVLYMLVRLHCNKRSGNKGLLG